MSIKTLSHWAQHAAAVGVIAGLALVAWELRQNQNLARAELNSESMTARDNFAIARQQEPLARAIAKAKEAPLELTGAERIMLDGYYNQAFGQIFREFVLIQRGVYEDNLDGYMRIFATNVLETAYGQVWCDQWIVDSQRGRLAARLEEFTAGWLDETGARADDELKQQLRDKFEF